VRVVSPSCFGYSSSYSAVNATATDLSEKYYLSPHFTFISTRFVPKKLAHPRRVCSHHFAVATSSSKFYRCSEFRWRNFFTLCCLWSVSYQKRIKILRLLWRWILQRLRKEFVCAVPYVGLCHPELDGAILTCH
jgi:hypothetical protein